MAIFNFGSINIDFVYRVPHLPQPGETIEALSFSKGLGGKGINQSIAASKAGSLVHHIGAVGPDENWILEEIERSGVNLSLVQSVHESTGHAIINVDQSAENAIVLFPGANHSFTEADLKTAIGQASRSDFFLLQNETNLGTYAAKIAKAKGMKVVYSAAPFSSKAVSEILDFTDVLIVNELEERQIIAEVPDASRRLSELSVLVTLGAKGARFCSSASEINSSAFSVTAVDTTGAGDTYLGYFLSGLDQGMSTEDAMRQAAAGAAIQVTRQGAAAAIPAVSEVQQFLAQNG